MTSTIEVNNKSFNFQIIFRINLDAFEPLDPSKFENIYIEIDLNEHTLTHT